MLGLVARLARAENPRHATWQQPNCMLREAHCQVVADRCRFMFLFNPREKSEEPEKREDLKKED